MTAAAVAFGAAAVTFGFGLATSLNRAFTDLSEASSLPVQVSAIPHGPLPSPGGGGKLGRAGMTAAQQRAVVSAIAAQPGTRHVVSRTDSDLGLPGLTHDVSVTAYGGNPAWSGLALNAGRWYSSSSRAREVVANTLFLTDTGTSVGSTYTLLSGGRRTTVRIVGEVFRPGNDLQLYLSPATLRAVDPGAAPDEYDVALTPGTSSGRLRERPLGDARKCLLRPDGQREPARADRHPHAGRDADDPDHRRRRTRRAEHGGPADPRAGARHRRVQGARHDAAADPQP